MRERAISDLRNRFSYQTRDQGKAYRCPPLSSVRLCFHTVPSRTLTSSPSIRSLSSGGCSFAKLPGRSSAKIAPKSLFILLARTGVMLSGDANVLVDFLPSLVQCIALVSIEFLDGVHNLLSILLHCLNVLEQL